jgi:hypothetical protein
VAILERGTHDPNRLVAEMARGALAKLLEGRFWVEAPPAIEAVAA